MVSYFLEKRVPKFQAFPHTINASRKIKVFSITAAYTIDHDKTDKSTGPDLMVSYHDNDHYNSVRDYNGKKPPSPSIPHHSTESSGESEPNVLLKEEENGISAELCSAPSSSKESEDSKALIPKNDLNNNEAAQAQGWLKKKKKRGGPCPCGSGQSYRKCCLASDKRKASDARRKMSSVNDSCTDISHKEENQSAQTATTEMENGFKVLNI